MDAQAAMTRTLPKAKAGDPRKPIPQRLTSAALKLQQVLRPSFEVAVVAPAGVQLPANSKLLQIWEQGTGTR